jgi:hypothetical protein
MVVSRWTDKQKEVFLDLLAATGNVAASCRAMTATTASAHTARRHDPEFAAAWHAAVITGYDRLEAALLIKAGAALDDAEREMDAGEIDVELAMRLLKLHKGRARDGKSTRTRQFARASSSEVDAELSRRLMLMRRSLTRATRNDA